jgi:hypothetical protein
MVLRIIPRTVTKLMVAATVSLLVLAAPAGAAGPPQQGSGEGVITIADIEFVREAGGNSVQNREIHGTVTGTLEGTFVQEVRGVVHPNGHVTFQGTMTFTGTVGECGEGTVTLGLSGHGQAGAFPITESRVQPIRQAANDVAVTGQGTVSQSGPFITYELQYACR